MKKYLSVVLVVLLIAVAASIRFNQSITLTYSLDVLAVDNIDDAVKNANYIVKGHFSNYVKEWNMLDDLKEQMIAKVYQFEIETCYKGNITDSIPVSMHYSTRLFYDNNGLIHGEAIKNDSQYVDVLEKSFVQPDNDKDYILFLTYNKSENVYQAAFHPYCVVINGNELDVVTNSPSSVYGTLLDETKKVKVVQNTYKSINFTKGISQEEFELMFE